MGYLIKRATFITSIDRVTPFPGQELAQIAMAGKSNVGKSSSINRIAGNGKLARVSQEPGKTRIINLYQVNDDLILADLPGYGFAKAPKSEKDKWGAMIEGYLSGSKRLRHVLHLVDIRHAPTSEDQMMTNYLRHYGIPFTVLANKADKLSRAQTNNAVQCICRTIAVQPWEVIPFSAQTGQNREKVLDLFEKIVKQTEVTD